MHSKECNEKTIMFVMSVLYFGGNCVHAAVSAKSSTESAAGGWQL